MKPLRTIAVEGAAAAALLVAQAVTAFAYEQHDPAVASLTLRRVRPRLSTTASPLPIRIALRSWPTAPESPASPSRTWVPWECTTSKVILSRIR